jgi:hypothetical protein
MHLSKRSRAEYLSPAKFNDSESIQESIRVFVGFMQPSRNCVTEPHFLRVKKPEPLRLRPVNLGCLGKGDFLGLEQLLCWKKRCGRKGVEEKVEGTDCVGARSRKCREISVNELISGGQIRA